MSNVHRDHRQGAGTPDESAPRQREDVTVLSAESSLAGDAVLTGKEVRIHGRFKGRVSCERLLIEETAEVEGDVEATVAVKVAGKLSGNVKAGKVLIARTGRIFGEVHGKEIGMELGAVVHGGFDTTSAEAGIEPRDAIIDREVRGAPGRVRREATRTDAPSAFDAEFEGGSRQPYLVASAAARF